MGGLWRGREGGRSGVQRWTDRLRLSGGLPVNDYRRGRVTRAAMSLAEIFVARRRCPAPEPHAHVRVELPNVRTDDPPDAGRMAAG